MTEHIRVLLAKPDHDGHDRGVRYTARKLRDAGFEVMFETFLLAEEVVEVALQENVDVIGISSSSHGHLPVFEDLFDALNKRGMHGMLVIAGGVISQNDQVALKEMGVAAVFGPGSSAAETIEFIHGNLREGWNG